MSVSKITIKIESSDDSDTEHSTIVPKPVAEMILMYLIEWKDEFSSTTTDHENFIREKEKFLNQKK